MIRPLRTLFLFWLLLTPLSTASAQTLTEATEQGKFVAVEQEDNDVPLVFLFVFGLPLFMTLIYMMLQLSRPDRGGRTDVDALPMPQEDTDTAPENEGA